MIHSPGKLGVFSSWSDSHPDIRAKDTAEITLLGLIIYLDHGREIVHVVELRRILVSVEAGQQHVHRVRGSGPSMFYWVNNEFIASSYDAFYALK